MFSMSLFCDQLGFIQRLHFFVLIYVNLQTLIAFSSSYTCVCESLLLGVSEKGIVCLLLFQLGLDSLHSRFVRDCVVVEMFKHDYCEMFQNLVE